VFRLAFFVVFLFAGLSSTHAQWKIEESHTTADLRGIHALGNGIAWASGTAGTVLRTTDDGAHWQRCTTPPDADHLDFRGTQAFDASTAIVMSSGKGSLSRLYKTTDGCQTWKLIFTNPDADGFFDAVKFQGRQSGFVVGDPIQRVIPIFASSDLGDSWARWTDIRGRKPAKARSGESLFAASNSALIVPGTEGAFAFGTRGRRRLPSLQSPSSRCLRSRWL